MIDLQVGIRVAMGAMRQNGAQETTMKLMKTHHTLLITLVPFLTPLSVCADPEKISTNLTETQSNERLSDAWRASEVMGKDVKNADNEDIGEVEDLAIDMKNGEILAVVISSGGFLGLADTLSSVPCSALRYDSPTKSFKTRLTKEQLQKAPQHKTTENPDYSDTIVRMKLREYRDLIGGSGAAADNSARNEVDANQRTVRPMDQGTSDTDVKTTKDLRAALLDSNLSTNAKNIKIITRDGHVTLRGVVDTAAERAAVTKIVGEHVDTAHVTDSLSVK